MDAVAKQRLVSIEQLSKLDGQLCASLQNDMTAFQKQAPDLVHQRGAVTDKLVTNAVQGLHVELFFAL